MTMIVISLISTDSNREIEACTQLIGNLYQIGVGLLELRNSSDPSCLFSNECHKNDVITRTSKEINQEVAFGRYLGFHVR